MALGANWVFIMTPVHSGPAPTGAFPDDLWIKPPPILPVESFPRRHYRGPGPLTGDTQQRAEFGIKTARIDPAPGKPRLVVIRIAIALAAIT